MPKVASPDSARNKGTRAFEVHEGEGIDEKPDLPQIDVAGEPIIWHPQVQKHWDNVWDASWWRAEFQHTDLALLEASMVMLNQFYDKPVAAFLTEFRMSVDHYGLSPAARRKLHITIGPVAAPKNGATDGPKKPPRKDPRAG